MNNDDGTEYVFPMASVTHTGSYHAIPMPPTSEAATAPPTCWERLQCWVFGSVDNLDLINATKDGRYEECKMILEKGTANINAQDEETKKTALHYAAAKGKLKFVELLLKYHPKCNAQDNSGNTPLHLAIQYSRINCYKRILQCDNLQITLANEAQDTPLHLAAKKGYVDIIDMLRDKELDYNGVDSLGNTVLHLAAEGGHLDCCRKLLNHNAENINARNNDENTPLHLAAKKGHSDIVALLQNYQADCNLQNSRGDTPLHIAVTKEHFFCFDKIIEYDNVKIDLTNNNHSTPLHCAVRTGNSEIVAQLLNRGANCNAQESSGDTPLHVAVTKRHYSCCEKLLKCSDLEINKKNQACEVPLHMAARAGHRNVCDLILQYSGIEINAKNKIHQTPLHLAAKQNNHEVIELLLKKGANWKLKDKYTYMPIHYAAEKGSKISCEHLTQAFEKNKKIKLLKLKDKKTPLMLAAKEGYHRCCGQLPLDDINDQDNCGNTALFYAMKDGCLKTATFLLEKKADTSIKNHDGRTVLHQAAKNRADACLSQVLRHLEQKDLLHVKDNKNSYTPLHEAIIYEALECAEILIKHGASLTDTCKDGMTPLHLAAKQGDPGICSLLVSHDIDVNKENNDKETPLHVAAAHGSRDACKILIRKGTRVFAPNKDGRTALHLAAEKGHDQVVAYLMKKGVSPILKDDKGSTALHLAAAEGKLRSCQILVTTARQLIFEVDKKNKLPLDTAFEHKRDEVFAFLIRKLKPKKEILKHHSRQSSQHKNSIENEERRKRFHKYMHQSLKPENHGKPRVIAVEAILESEWWSAGFFPDMNTTTQEKNQYCTNFHELINSHPSLALKAQNCCYGFSSTKSGQTHDFRLFEDNLCPEAGQKNSTKQHALNDGPRLLREHPVSLMVQHTRGELLQHPLTEAWLMHLWKTYISVIFTALLTIEMLFLASLNCFMGNVDNWAQIQHICNTTQEKFCGLSSLPEKARPASIVTEKTENGTISLMASDSSFSTCYWQYSPWHVVTWLFLFFMTCFILVLECIYLYRLRAEFFKLNRSLRIIQVILTILALLPIAVCGFPHPILNTWQWHCGIIGLLLEWILFIDRLNKLPVLFVFMPVTRLFLWNYMKALGYILLLLFAFSYVFHLVIAEQAAFESMSGALMKMIVWLLGDLNYDDTFVEGHLVHPCIARHMFAAFIIIMGGFIANLAIATPADRVNEFRKDAVFFQRAAQSTLFLEIKASFPHVQKLIISFGGSDSRRNIIFDKLAQKIFTPNTLDEKIMPVDTTMQKLEEQVATLVNLCRDQREELKDLKLQMKTLLTRIPEVK